MDITRNFLKAKLPHTFARVLHLRYLLSDANLELYDRRDLLIAILPIYLIYYHDEIRMHYSGSSWTAESLFDDLITSLVFLFFFVYFYDSLYAIGLVFSTPTILGKLICAFDLWLESVCVISFQLVSAMAVKALLDQFFGWPAARFVYNNLGNELRAAWQAFRDEMRRA